MFFACLSMTKEAASLKEIAFQAELRPCREVTSQTFGVTGIVLCEYVFPFTMFLWKTSSAAVFR